MASVCAVQCVRVHYPKVAFAHSSAYRLYGHFACAASAKPNFRQTVYYAFVFKVGDDVRVYVLQYGRNALLVKVHIGIYTIVYLCHGFLLVKRSVAVVAMVQW